MDLSKLSTEDLLALKAGDLSKVSTEGLRALRSQAPAQGPAKAPNPTDGMTGAQLEEAGLGRAVANIGRNIGLYARKGIEAVAPPQQTLSGLVTGQKGNSLADVIGLPTQADVDEANRLDQALLNTSAGKRGDITGSIVATLPVGAAIAAPVKAGMAKVGLEAPAVVNALASAGMRTGAAPTTAAGKVLDAATRVAAGGVIGGVSAGVVDPKSADTGAMVGAALPGVVKAAGMAGQAVGKVVRGPEQTPQMAAAVEGARELGLVVPPTQARATIGNRLMEGMAGKLTTAQNASAKNAPRVMEIVARDLGIPEGVPLNTESLGAVKKAAGVMYDAVSSAGTVTPGAAYQKALDDIAAPAMQAAKGFPNAKPSPVIDLVDSLRSPSFDAASAVAKIKELRSAADDAFRAGSTDVARASKAASKALEDALEAHLKSIGEPQLLGQFKDARQLYAKAVSVEKAMDATTGTVDARKLAAQLQKGKPLSGDTRKVAEAAAQFKTAFKPPEQMGSLPQLSPLDWAAGAGLGTATGNPLAALAVAARPAMRSVALSPIVQNRLIQPAAGPSMANPFFELVAPRIPATIAADR